MEKILIYNSGGGLGDSIEDAIPIPDMTGDVIPRSTAPLKPF